MASRKELLIITLCTITASCIVYIIGWSINVMDVDASQYASMTREMLERADFLHFTDRGKDYLDKPPLLFWLSGISMHFFGVNNIAYRIPAFLATLLAIYATFRLTNIYYSKRIAYLAAIILATLQATFLINHDVRTDTNLMCWFIFTIWQMAAFLEYRKYSHLILAFAGIALAMLSKGPIGLVAPALGVFMHLLIKKDWKSIFSSKWLVGVIIIGLLLLPMTYGLYTQFDLHPEKLVNGQTGVSGVRFFYWTQSFGRITGESIWENDAGPFFLSHTTLWAFAPWSLFLVLGLILEFKNLYLYLSGKIMQREFLVLFGFTLPFMALSSSRYQLPHYAFIVYPLGAIISAKYIDQLFYNREKKKGRLLFAFHVSLLFIILSLVLYLVWLSFPQQSPSILVISVTAVLVYYYFIFILKSKHRLILISVFTGICANLTLNLLFYPQVLKYQAGSEMASKAVLSGLVKGRLYSYKAETPYSLDFYSQTFAHYEENIEMIVNQKNIWVFTQVKYIEEIQKRRPDVKVIYSMGGFPVSQLTMRFLIPSSREATLEPRCLVKL